MRFVGVFLCLVLASMCSAQNRGWELGAAGGFGWMSNAAITNPAGSVSAGFDNRFALGAVVSQDLYEHLSGDLRYTFRDNDLVLKAAGQKVNMDGDSNLIHYDLLLHLFGRSARIRPYAAGGAGIRYFRATGKEYVNQPFNDFAHLTRTNQVKPLISVGGGVKARVTDRISVRIDARDYFSPFPEELFVAAPGAKIKGWLHDFVPLAGISFRF